MAKKTKLSSMVAKAVPVKIVNSTADMPLSRYTPSAEDKERERKYRAEDDIRTMQRAEEIRADKERMKAMKSIAKEQMNGLKKIC
jgi:hypothetical protein